MPISAAMYRAYFRFLETRDEYFDYPGYVGEMRQRDTVEDLRPVPAGRGALEKIYSTQRPQDHSRAERTVEMSTVDRRATCTNGAVSRSKSWNDTPTGRCRSAWSGIPPPWESSWPASSWMKSMRPTSAVKSFAPSFPCGPSSWYEPFTSLVNRTNVSLRRFVVYHMDECLDWQGRELPRAHPYSFRGFMEQHFYATGPRRALPCRRRTASGFLPQRWKRCVRPSRPIRRASPSAGGARTATSRTTRRAVIRTARSRWRSLPSPPIRIQENNWDTILALAQRTFGTAWQFVPPLSVTLGIRECLSARPRPPVLRHRRLEADRAARGAVLRAHRRVPDDASAEPPRRPDHRDGRHGTPSHLDAPGVGPGPVDVSGVGLLGTARVRAVPRVWSAPAESATVRSSSWTGTRRSAAKKAAPGRFLDRSDYCKLHIICHYVKALLGEPNAT